MNPKLISEKIAKMAKPFKKRQSFATFALGAALTILPAINADAQMNKWAIPPTSLGMASSPVASNPLYTGAASNDSYFVSNGAYDNSGNLLFYVKDNQVFNKLGVAIGQLGDLNSGYSPSSHYVLGGEVAIVPIPGTCGSFYIIYSRSDGYSPNYGTSSAVGYVKVDASSSSAPVISYNGGTDGFLITPTADMGSYNSSIAVSQKIGSGVSACYYLYYTSYNGGVGGGGAAPYGIMEYAKITSSGITYGGVIGGTGDDLGWNPELELSADGSWLAAAGKTSSGPIEITIFQLSPGTISSPPSMITSNAAGSYNRVCGLEFVPGSGSVPDLYVSGIDGSGNGAFDQIDIVSGSVTNRQSTLGGHSLQYSFLEYAKNGFLYGFEHDYYHPTLVEYQPNSTGGYVNNTYVMNTISNKATPNHGAWCYLDVSGAGDPDTYTLPDQIDGADYSNFNTPIQITGMGINGWLAQNNCDGTAYDIFACDGVHLTAFIGDDQKACNQQLSITPYNLSGCEDIFTTGVGYLHYAGDVKGPIRDMAIHELRDNYGNSFMNVQGVYKVTVTITDCCGNTSSMTEYIRIKQPPHINLEVFNGPGGSLYMPAGFFHSSPLGAGALSLGFKVNLSTGDASNMNVKVDQLTGSWGGAMSISNILNQDVAVTNLSSIANEPLNNYCVPTGIWPVYPGLPTCNVTSPSAYTGNPNFFSSNNTSIVGNYYRLTVTLSNECGSSSDYAYMQISDAYQRLTSVQELSAGQNVAEVYPNPANDKMQIAIKSQQSDVYQIALYDLSGRLIKTIADKVNLEAGDHTIDVNTTDLQNGVYIWKINSAGVNKNGRVTIMK